MRRNTGMTAYRHHPFGRPARTLALWLGLLALTIQGLAPLCLPGIMRTAGGPSIILCTAHGLQTVHLGADGKPLSNTPAPNQQNSDCPLCAAAHIGGGFTAPALVALSLPPIARERVARLAPAPVPALKAYFPYVTRAPPALA
jgi:hypothetical protein